jgi:hypothetical protein
MKSECHHAQLFFFFFLRWGVKNLIFLVSTSHTAGTIVMNCMLSLEGAVLLSDKALLERDD